MGGVRLSTETIIPRNRQGQYIARCYDAAHDGVESVVNKGAALSEAFAPKRSGVLAGSITPVMTGQAEGHWFTDVDYATPQEEGAAPHDIPNSFGYGPLFGVGGRFGGMFHPGNPPTGFMAAGYELAKDTLVEELEARWP